jgi:hypothetical protein
MILPWYILFYKPGSCVCIFRGAYGYELLVYTNQIVLKLEFWIPGQNSVPGGGVAWLAIISVLVLQGFQKVVAITWGEQSGSYDTITPASGYNLVIAGIVLIWGWGKMGCGLSEKIPLFLRASFSLLS